MAQGTIAPETVGLYRIFDKFLPNDIYHGSISDGRPYYKINGKEFRVHLRQATIDKGSKTSPNDRIRFQIPGTWFPFDASVENVVMGYVASADVWLARYMNSYLPNTHQVNRSTYEDNEKQAISLASKTGITTYKMQSGETLVAVRSDFLEVYLMHMKKFHGKSVPLGRHIAFRSDNGLIKTDLEHPKTKRQPHHRRLTMQAYNHTCAICGIQGPTVEAAHAFAVRHGGNNTVNNGIALCKNHHILFDDGLLAILPDYTLQINYKRLKDYQNDNRAFGLLDCLNSTQKLRLPQNPTDWPNPEFLRKTMQHHGWEID